MTLFDIKKIWRTVQEIINKYKNQILICSLMIIAMFSSILIYDSMKNVENIYSC